MHIRAYFFNSFLVHALLLIYVLSLPLHRPTFEFGSYGTYFVSIKSATEMPTKIPSPSYTAKKSKPEIHSTLKFTKSASVTKETDVSKDTMSLQAKKETVSENETELKEKEVPEEKPVQATEVKKPEELQKVAEAPIKEAPAPPLPPSPDPSKADKKEIVEKEGITIVPPQEKTLEKPVQVAKVTTESETGKKAEPRKEEVIQETVVPAPEDTETKEPAKDIPVGEKPEADVSATKEASLTEKTPSQEKVFTPVVNKAAGLQEIGHVAREKGKVEGEKETAPSAGTDKKQVSSAKGLKEETVNSKGKGEPESNGSTLKQTVTSSEEGYASGQVEGNQQPIAQAKQEGEGKPIVEEKSHGMGIPVSEVLVPVDLKIEVFLRKSSSIHSEHQTQKVTAPSTVSKQKNMPKATEITQISLEESGDGIKVLIKGNGSMAPKAFSLDKNRIVIDFPKTAIHAQLPSKVALPLKEIRSGKHKDKSRLVLELSEKMPFDVSSSGDTVVVKVLKSSEIATLPLVARNDDDKTSPPAVEQKAEEKIETKELKETDISNISMRLLKNVHPMANRREKQTEVSLLEGKREAHSVDTSAVRKTFSVLRTAEGAYTFAIQNQENETFAADLVFLIFPGKKGERTKKFAAVELSPHTTVRFKFILPEAIFWDDEEHFSGKIENSDTMTKFNQKTGFVWKETKDE
jgi:hypothetical protein